MSSACFANTRATSKATFPFPITPTDSASSGQDWETSGCESYQLTKSAAPYEPSRSTPGMFRGASVMHPVEKITASYRSVSSSKVMSEP